MTEIIRACSASADALWQPLSDVESWPLLLPTVTDVRRLDDGSQFTEGARFRVTQPRLRTAEYVVTHVDPGRSFTWVAHAPGITTTARHSLRPGRRTCLLHLDIDWSGPLAWVARLFYSRLARRYMELEAAAVEDIAVRAETDRHPSPVDRRTCPGRTGAAARTPGGRVRPLRPAFGTAPGATRGHH